MAYPHDSGGYPVSRGHIEHNVFPFGWVVPQLNRTDNEFVDKVLQVVGSCLAIPYIDVSEREREREREKREKRENEHKYLPDIVPGLNIETGKPLCPAVATRQSATNFDWL